MFGEGWTNEHEYHELHSHQKPVNLNMSRWSYSPSGPTEIGTAKTGWGIVIVEHKLAGLWHNLCSFLAQLAPTTPTRKGNHMHTIKSTRKHSGIWILFTQEHQQHEVDVDTDAGFLLIHATAWWPTTPCSWACWSPACSPCPSWCPRTSSRSSASSPSTAAAPPQRSCP